MLSLKKKTLQRKGVCHHISERQSYQTELFRAVPENGTTKNGFDLAGFTRTF